ncbi:hypothetical protein FN846DRAFT_261355 [Sphaerosporella brunnea]|uniref:Uncharacterized protein n=1 Tax=Sphaerosporella brunnea TaxID=1250544 RepID=A0A5J5EN36_9PEZI|nr:hypothetical protein FN846DRAFT_261355 [Sphaerosporella brunnea]
MSSIRSVPATSSSRHLSTRSMPASDRLVLMLAALVFQTRCLLACLGLPSTINTVAEVFRSATFVDDPQHAVLQLPTSRRSDRSSCFFLRGWLAVFSAGGGQHITPLAVSSWHCIPALHTRAQARSHVCCCLRPSICSRERCKSWRRLLGAFLGRQILLRSVSEALPSRIRSLELARRPKLTHKLTSCLSLQEDTVANITGQGLSAD